MTTAAPATTPVMERLRNETLESHKTAEHHPFQQALAHGNLPQNRYVANLGQLFLTHKLLERELRATAANLPAIKSIVRDYQYQENYLREDLTHFGVIAEKIEPTPATTRILSQITDRARTNPLSLMGMHYVLEGSKNGSKFLCRVVQKAYGLKPGPGTRYMDPYGDQQRVYWEQFKTDMNAAGFSDVQATELVAAAREMFDAIGDIGGDVLNQSR